MKLGKAYERGSRKKNPFILSVLKVSFDITCTASVFTRNTRRLLFIRKVEICSVIGVPRLLSFGYIVNGGARLELTLKISLISIEFYLFFNCFLFDFLLNIHV
jgi:hypothetical protein